MIADDLMPYITMEKIATTQGVAEAGDKLFVVNLKISFPGIEETSNFCIAEFFKEETYTGWPAHQERLLSWAKGEDSLTVCSDGDLDFATSSLRITSEVILGANIGPKAVVTIYSKIVYEQL